MEWRRSTRVVFLRQQTDSQILARTLLDRQVLNPHADHLGRVHDVVVDHDGRVIGILLSVGGFLGLGDKLVGVSWSDVTIRFDGKSLVVNLSQDELLQAPEYLPWQQVRRGLDARALDHSPKASDRPEERTPSNAIDWGDPAGATAPSIVDSNARRDR